MIMNLRTRTLSAFITAVALAAITTTTTTTTTAAAADADATTSSSSTGYKLTDPAAVEQAFTLDGWSVTHWFHYNSSQGCIAEHNTATNLRTRLPKVAYYVEGTGYEMGFLTGMMAADAVA